MKRLRDQVGCSAFDDKGEWWGRKRILTKVEWKEDLQDNGR